MQNATVPEDVRSRALASLKKKSEFRAHLLAYVLINGASVVIWAMTGGAFFWPVFVMLGWGIGLVFHAWDAYGRGPTEEQIRREIEKMR